MIIRKANTNDADAVTEIFELCRKGMNESGIDQWQSGTPNRNIFLSDLENGYATVGEDGGKIVAYCALVIGRDHTYDVINDGKWKTDNEIYATLHRVAVHPEYRNHGAASQFMQYCKDVCKENGISSMRIDTHKDNLAMQHTILKNGYEYCGIIHIDDGTERLAFELVRN